MTFLSSFLRRLPLPQNGFRSSVITIKIAGISHLITTHVGCVYNSSGPSMLPTITAHGDAICVSKFYRRGKGVKVGDVVSFRHPMFPEFGAVKRVVGMPGDFVGRDSPGTGRGRGMMIQVPEGHCWLIGDNLPESRDSRTFGPLPLALIKGKVVAHLGTDGGFGWIGNNLEPAEAES